MNHNSRKPEISSAQAVRSKDPLRSMVSDPSKGGRVAATALGRPSTHHDHVNRSSKDYNGKPKDQSRPQPRLDRNENVDRERDIKRTKAAGGERVVRDESSSREREILSQSLKRTKAAAGGEDIPKQVKDRDQERAKGDNRERDLLRRSSLEKPKSATRPDGTRASVPDKAVKKETSRLLGDIAKRENLSSDRKPDNVKLRPENPKSGATRPDGARVSVLKKDTPRLPEEKPGDIVKKVNLSSDTRKRTIGEMKDVQPRSVTKIEPVVATSNKNGRDVSRSVKMVTGTVMKAKQEKVKKKMFSLPGQRFEAPEERDALRLFYGSLHRQIPTSDMANIWLMEHGLLEADEAQRVLTQKVKSKSTGFVSKTPTPSKFSNGKGSKFKSEDLLELKPVSKKLKL